jgi:polar amino acid transport system permease protein
MAEIYRGGIVSIGRGQSEAGRVLGLTYVQRLRYVILPQAIRKMIPALTSQTIDVFKLSAIASLIAVNELVYNTRVVAESEFRPIEAYTALAIVYAILLVPAAYASSWFENRRKKLAGIRSRRAANTGPGALDLTIS